MSLIQEFKEFAVKGNAVDMAVGIIIGAAFTKVVNSLVSDIIMPPLGVLLGGVDFKDLAITLVKEAGEKPAVVLKYGLFVNTVIDFMIVAFAMFMVIKAMNKVIRKREPEKAA
jgi:large conductance mechanosensitive channel